MPLRAVRRLLLSRFFGCVGHCRKSYGYVFRPVSASMRGMAGSLATVLICDDEPSLRELIRVSLDGPYSFAEADDGEESLEIARRLRPDLIILDMMMPRRTGLEVLAELRRDEDLSGTPVIVLTAQPATREEALRKGADVVMVKPFEPQQITAAVEEVLAGRQ
jgi:CheY-like chemotaxis protein